METTDMETTVHPFTARMFLASGYRIELTGDDDYENVSTAMHKKLNAVEVTTTGGRATFDVSRIVSVLLPA